MSFKEKSFWKQIQEDYFADGILKPILKLINCAITTIIYSLIQIASASIVTFIKGLTHFIWVIRAVQLLYFKDFSSVIDLQYLQLFSQILY